MALLPLTYAPNPIFKKKATPVKTIDDSIRQIIDDMFETLECEKAVGMASNMVGRLENIAIVDLHPEGLSKPYTFINPAIIWTSEETQEHDEASLCFPGISAKIRRPNSIKLQYLDYGANEKTLEAEGFFSTVIQHEVDYLNGKTFLDHLSKTRRDMLIKKMKKHIKLHPPQTHKNSCEHSCQC